jgi:MoxR-like ATPase
VRTVRVADEVEAYVVALVRATRSHPDIELGASPRATVALYRASQAAAVLEGRDFVLPDDVKRVATPVLGHRLTLNLDRTLHGATIDTVLASILGAVAAPPVKAD